jgi:hypothetical protein
MMLPPRAKSPKVSIVTLTVCRPPVPSSLSLVKTLYQSSPLGSHTVILLIEKIIVRGLLGRIFLKHRPDYQVVSYHKLILNVADAWLARVVEPHRPQDRLSSETVEEEGLRAGVT